MVDASEDPPPPSPTKTTRSGRNVRHSALFVPDASPQSKVAPTGPRPPSRATPMRRGTVGDPSSSGGGGGLAPGDGHHRPISVSTVASGADEEHRAQRTTTSGSIPARYRAPPPETTTGVGRRRRLREFPRGAGPYAVTDGIDSVSTGVSAPASGWRRSTARGHGTPVPRCRGEYPTRAC